MPCLCKTPGRAAAGEGPDGGLPAARCTSWGRGLGLTPVSIPLKDKQANLQAHEHAALRDHLLLVLERNFRLEEQVSPPGLEPVEGVEGVEGVFHALVCWLPATGHHGLC